MKNTVITRIIAFTLLITVMLTLALPASSANYEQTIHNRVTPIAAVSIEDNDNVTILHEYDDGKMPIITPVQNADGTYCVCVNEGNGALKIFELDADNKVSNTFVINCELDELAAFTKGSNGKYYILFAARLGVNDKTKTALRLVEYNSNLSISRYVNIPANASGSLTTRNLLASNGSLKANDKYVTGYIGKQMFPDQNGISHQASYAFAINMSDFSLVHSENSTVIPYASHSFHQMIVNDGKDFLYVDRCDAFPTRAFHLTKMSGKTWTKIAQADSFSFKGTIAYNNTYGQLGGLIPCSDGYLLVGTYQNATSALNDSSANLFVQKFATQNLNPSPEKYLTDYSDFSSNPNGITTVMNPKAVRVSADRIAVSYMLCNETLEHEEMRVMFIDNSGNVISDKSVHANNEHSVVPKYGEVMYNSKNGTIDWFSIIDGALVLNSLEECVGEESCPLYTPVTAIVPKSNSITVAKGQSMKLKVALEPVGAVTFLKWSSHNDQIARVDNNGLLTGVELGTTTLTVTAHNGVTAQVNVNVIERVPVQSIQLQLIINPTAESVPIDAKDIQIETTDMLYYSVNLSPNNATDKKYDVRISNPSVLLWSKNGDCFKPLKNGVCVLEFYSVSDPSVSKTFIVTVGDETEITVNNTSWSWTADGKAQMTVTYTADGTYTHTINADVSSSTTPATCTQAGSTTYTATAVFNSTTYTDTKTVTIPVSHSYGEWTTTEQPTCTESGEKTRSCTICGNTDTAAIPATGHSYGEWATTEQPTCTESGEKTRSCSICGNTDTAAIPATGHSFGEWVTEVQATRQEDGKKSRTCSVCGHTEYQTIPRITASKIEIVSMPEKTVYTYKKDSSLVTDGLVIKATYPDGTTEQITDSAELSFSGFDSSQKGDQTITVTYENVKTTFNVNVKMVWWQWLITIVLFGWLWY